MSDNEILIAGGFGASNLERDCYLLDTTHNTLKSACDLPQPDKFFSPSALIHGEEMFVFGLSTSTVYKYSININKWKEVHIFK